MPLYIIRDANRPAFVVADDVPEAVNKWRWAVACREDATQAEIPDPKNVECVCQDVALIIFKDLFDPFEN